MDLINKNVQHRVFGKGTIIDLSEDIVTVRFGTEEKKFVYPDAFKAFLVLSEKKSRLYVESVVNQKDGEIRRKREKEIQETIKKKKLLSLPVYPKAHAAFGFNENSKEDVIKDGTVFAGRYLTGYNRGNPRTPAKIYPYSACLLTGREKTEKEIDRTVWGVFMVKEDFIGSDCTDGMIPAHETYRIFLRDDESKKIRYYRYFDGAEAQGIKWGSVEIKYISSEVVANILGDIADLKQGTEDQKPCEEFLDYYCRLNRIFKRVIPDDNDEKQKEMKLA